MNETTRSGMKSSLRSAAVGMMLLSAFFIASCNEKSGSSFQRAPIDVVTSDGVSVEVYDFEHFEPFLNRKNDTVYVVNFWATWCAPCIKELPHFERLGREYRDTPLQVLLVSLDFRDKVESATIPFINNKKLQSEVILLDDPGANTWIPKVDPDWSGAIPATVIVAGDRRAFFERSFTYEELTAEVDRLIE